MARNVFYSFHYKNDFWRTQQVRNMGFLEGQSPCLPNAWEEIRSRGDASIERWIDSNMVGKSCVVVLVGSETAQRPWVIKEIQKGWNSGKGVVGIRIHKLLNADGNSSAEGDSPFDKISLHGSGRLLSSIVPLYSPAGHDSKAVYSSIRDGIEGWVESAIAIRNRY